MTDNIISLENKRKELREKMKGQFTDDTVYCIVVIPTTASGDDGGGAFVEMDERVNPYEAIGILEFGKSLILASAESGELK